MEKGLIDDNRRGDLFMKDGIRYECKLSGKLTDREKDSFVKVFNEVLILIIIWTGLTGSIWTISMEIPIWF